MAGELSIVSTEPDTTSVNPLKVVSSAPVPKVTSDDVERVAKEYGVPADLAVAVAHIESRNDPLAKSNKGAQGVMQLMPDTATRYGVNDPYDPEQNIRGGVQYLRDLMKQFGGDRDKVLAAYNWGEHNVDKGKKLPAETEQYISDVNAKAKEHVRENLKVVSTEPEPAQPLQVVSTEPDVPLQSMHGQKTAGASTVGDTGATISQQPKSGWLSRMRDAIANTAIGHSLQSEFPHAAEKLGLTPTETVQSPTYESHKEQFVAPEYLVSPQSHGHGANVIRGALQATGEFTSAPTLSMIAATAATAGLGEAAVPALGRMVSAGFTAQAAVNMVMQVPQLIDLYHEDPQAFEEELGKLSVNAANAVVMGAHAAGKEIPVPGIKPEFRRAEEALHREATWQGAPKVVGSPQEPVVAETDQTVQHQVEALKNGTIDTVMIPKGQTMPQVPEGMKSVTVDKGKGEGTYIYDPKKTNGDYIRQQAEAGKHGALLGHLQSKDELAGKDTVVVQAHAKDGTPIQDSEVENHPEQIEAQKAAMQRRHPDAEVVVKTPQEVLTARAGEAQEVSGTESGTQGSESEEWKSVPFYSEPYVEGENGFNRAWRLSDSPTSDDVVGDTTYRSKLTKGGEAVQVRAYRNGEEIGGASLDIDPSGEGKNFAESNDLSVKESERGKGVARQLYDNLPKIAKRYGVDTIQGERVKTEGGTGVWDSLVRDGKAYRTKDQYGQDVVRMGERPQEGPSLSEEHVRSILEKHPSISPEQVDSMFSVWRNYAEKYHGIPFDEYLNRAMRGEGFGVGGRYEGEEGLQQARRAGGDGVTWAYHPQKGILADRAGRKGHEQLLYEAGVDNMFGRAYDRMPRGRATVDPYSQQLVVTMQGEGDLSTSAERELRRSLDVPDNYTTRVVQSSSAPSTLYQRQQPVWYSKMARTMEDPKTPAAGSGEQWLKMLENKGVKRSEIEATGLDDFLKDKKKVTKQDLQDFIKANQVEVKEVMRGGMGPRPTLEQQHAIMEWASKNMPDAHDSIEYTINKIRYSGDLQKVGDLEMMGIPDDLLEPFRNYAGGERGPKFPTQVLPGGENYRELLLTLPEREGETKGPRGWGDTGGGTQSTRNFRGGHFDEPNVLAHIRFNDRFIPDPDGPSVRTSDDKMTRSGENEMTLQRGVPERGHKVLFLEEIQSDWHQKGRKHGYLDAVSKKGTSRQAELNAQSLAADAKRSEIWGRLLPLLNKDDIGGFDRAADAAMDASRPEGEEGNTYSPETVKVAREWRVAAEESQRLRDQLIEAVPLHAVPDAPFKKDWHELALRRMLRYAAENGYDKIGWTTGEQQAERYDLSKQVDMLRYDWIGDDKYQIHALVKDGNYRDLGTFSESKLPDVVGKELAQKIVADHNGDYPENHVYKGVDLKVGGSGMKGFYDKIIPDYLNRYGKKFGAKVGETKIATGEHERLDYSGPDRTLAEVEAASRHADNVSIERQYKDIADAMRGGASFKEALEAKGSMTAAAELGGSAKWVKSPKAESVHSLDVTPDLRKSVMEGQPLFQVGEGEVRGLTNFANDGKAFIRLFENADFSTFAHESFHVMRRHLKPEDLKVLESEFGVKDGRWTVDAEEKSARAWERYLHDGVAPEPKLVELFRKMKEWMTGIYRTLADGDLEAEVSPAVRKVFNKMLTGEHEQMVKDREPLAPADIVKVPTQDLVLDPHRFQYKLNVNERGVTNALEGRVWNPELAGIISAWKDPADGKIYVINGHHRVVLAGENNVPTMNVQMIEADTAAEARSAGALQNIAEGHGTAIDAAKFFRDTGLTLGDLEKKGITITESKAEDGLALANLSQPIFDEVATGKMRVGRGVAIGSATEDHAQQEAVLKLIRKKENAGKAVSDAVVTELGRMAKSTKDKTEHRDTLFGVESMTRNLLLEKAEVSEYIRKQIGQEKKLFGTVSSESAAQRLGKGGNVIEAEKNAEIANSAAQAQELYDRFSVKTGDINDILNRAADELADGENPNAVKQRAYEDTRTALSKTLGEGKERGAERVQENPQAAQADAEPPAGEHQGPVEDQGATLFQRKKPVHAETGPLLPGMEDVPEERKQALAEAEGETLTGELTQPKGDISRAAGEMEQKSPLFRGTEASPQNEMFGGTAELADEGPGEGRLFSGTPLPDTRLVRAAMPNLAAKFDQWVAGDETVRDRQAAMQRQTRGEMDRALSIVAKKLDSYKKEWVRRSREDTQKFAQAVEGLIPVDGLSPRDQELARFFKQGFDEIRSQIQAVKPEVLRSYIENYFPHIWKNPSGAEKAIKNALASKKPFAGSERFRQKRTVPTIEDGLAMGLEPISWNPVDLFLLKYKEEAQYLMAHKTLDMMKDQGTAKFVRVHEEAPQNWQRLDDRIGTVYGKQEVQTVEPGQRDLLDEEGRPRTFTVIRGHYYAPKEAATVFNNYVSRGFAGRYRTYDIAQGLNSNLNALQLGISAFHATTTSVNAATSDIALGIQQMFSEGKPIEGAKNVVMGASTVPSIVRTFRNGSKLMQEYLTPGSYEKVAREADAVALSGGRFKQQTIQLNKIHELMNAWANKSPKDVMRNLPGALIEGSVWPVMEWYVPRMKFGAFYNMAHDILGQSLEENWPQEKTRARIQKAWDSIDNRFGQMVYDNLFWHKSVRDSLMLATRSVGWNYGTIRELGAAPVDLAQQTARLTTGKGNLEISDRLAFAIALPLYTALVGATMTYAMTGKKPQTWKDYYYPPKGDGTRLNIPGYMKDEIAYIHDPKQTVLNKFGPLIEMTAEAIQNRDFYGTEIRHKDDPFIKQMGQLARFVGATTMPFSFTGGKKLLQKQGEDVSFELGHPLESTKRLAQGAAKHPSDVLFAQFGFQSAPAFVQHTPALNKAYGYQFENRPAGTRTSEQAEHHQYMLFLTDMFRKGNVDDSKIDKLIESGKILPEDVETAEKNSTVDPLELSARSLYLPQLLNVFAVASDEEKEMLRPVIAGKMGQLRRETDPDKRKQMIKALIKTGIIGSADEVGDEQ